MESSSIADYSTAEEDAMADIGRETTALDLAAQATRLEQIRASVIAHTARFESLLSLIPPEQFQHLSDREEDAAAGSAPKAQRKKAVKAIWKATGAAIAGKGDGELLSADPSHAFDAQRVENRPSGVEKKPTTSQLKERLDAKIKAMQAARAPTREGLLADRRAKRERQAERKREERKQARKEVRQSENNRAILTAPIDPPPAPSAEDALVLEQVKRGGTTIGFGQFDFTPTTAVRDIDTRRKKARKDARPSLSSHDPKQALAALQDRQRFLSTHTEQARERAEDRDKWANMMSKAEGAKIYDDEAKLRKAIRKQEKLKKRSRDKWDERHQTVEEAKAARQQLRAINLARRKEEANRPKGKRKARPGFEGGPAPKRKAQIDKGGVSLKQLHKKGNSFGPPS